MPTDEAISSPSQGRVTANSECGQEQLFVPPPLHELEAEVMEVVWERGEATVREVMAALNDGAPKERAYTTYMTIMGRLGAKGMLRSRREGKADFYSPTCTRHQYTDMRARAELESVLEQYGEAALAHMARQIRHSIRRGATPCSAWLGGRESMRRAHHAIVLPLAFLLAGAGAAASAAPVGAAIASVHAASATSGRLQLAGIPFSYPRLNAGAWILLGLALIGASAIAVAVRAVLRQRRAYRRLLARLEVVGHLRDHPSVHVIADPRPHAFCAGYLRPRVYVSQAALDLLSDAQLDAVLAHEHHHRRVRDPLRLACGRVLSQALFFVPALRALFARYADLAELNADDAAVSARAGGRAALASALLAFDAMGAGISPERVDSLLGQAVGWRPPWRLLTASFASLASLAAMTSGASQAASARATFNFPFVSAQPCLAMLLVPLLAGVAIIGRRAAARRGAARDWQRPIPVSTLTHSRPLDDPDGLRNNL